ncbi:hypothetical protein C1703_18385 [Streptomyces sp. Go-475]|nr:hypothetical protein C1703_18385 [Streptomyces sp. Go-475]
MAVSVLGTRAAGAAPARATAAHHAVDRTREAPHASPERDDPHAVTRVRCPYETPRTTPQPAYDAPYRTTRTP